MSAIDIDQNAPEVIADINASDDKEAVQAAWAAEAEKGDDNARSTVLTAAEARLEFLNLPGEVGGDESGAHSLLVDEDGNVVEPHVVVPLMP